MEYIAPKLTLIGQTTEVVLGGSDLGVDLPNPPFDHTVIASETEW